MSCRFVEADSLFFLTLYLIVAKLATVFALGGVILSARINMITPPSTRRSASRVRNLWLNRPWPGCPILPWPCPHPSFEFVSSIFPSDGLPLIWTWLSSTINIDWRSNEGYFSLARMVDRMALKRGAKPLRHVYTISSS